MLEIGLLISGLFVGFGTGMVVMSRMRKATTCGCSCDRVIPSDSRRRYAPGDQEDDGEAA